jgi:hypothetical protein
MSLHEKLKKHRIKFEEHAKPEILEVMRRANDSGILDRALKVGDKAPEFELENTAGEMIRSKDILADRLIVLTFYRGTW